jgi:hypothetical protein
VRPTADFWIAAGIALVFFVTTLGTGLYIKLTNPDACAHVAPTPPKGGGE